MSDGSLIDLLTESVRLARTPVETACKLIEGLLGEPFKIAGGMLADQLYAWQWRNRIEIVNKAKEHLNARGIAIRVVPPGFLLPLLEGAGYAEDGDLQESWARLLAAAVADEGYQHPLYIDVLRRMSGDDARVLSRLAPYVFPSKAIRAPAQPGDSKSVDRLVALGVLERGYADPQELFGPTHIFMSPLGFQLAEALGLELAKIVVSTQQPPEDPTK